MTTFLLIRHAAYDWLNLRLAGRTPGLHLNAHGERQARQLAQAFCDLNFRAILTSPLERARETAQPLSQRSGRPLVEHEDLNEIDFGKWSGCSFAELEDDPLWRRWNEERENSRPPGGESMQEARARMMSALTNLANDHSDGLIAAVTHGDMIRAAILACRGQSMNDIHQLEIAPASVSAFQFQGSSGHVLFANTSASVARSILALREASLLCEAT